MQNPGREGGKWTREGKVADGVYLMEPATVIRKWRAVPGETPRNGIKHTRQNDPPLDVKEVGYLHTNSSHRFRAVNFRALGLPP